MSDVFFFFLVLHIEKLILIYRMTEVKTGKYLPYYKFNIKHLIRNILLRVLGLSRLVYKTIKGLYESRSRYPPICFLCKMTQPLLSRKIVYFDGK